MTSRHDPIAVLRLALRVGDRPLARLLAVLLSRDPELQMHVEAELRNAARVPPAVASLVLDRLTARLGLLGS